MILRITSYNVCYTKLLRDFYGERTLPETFGYFSKGVRESGQFQGEMLPKYCPSRKFVDVWKKKIFEVVDKYSPDFLWFDSRLFLISEKA